jgi:hypothetical protein
MWKIYSVEIPPTPNGAEGFLLSQKASGNDHSRGEYPSFEVVRLAPTILRSKVDRRIERFVCPVYEKIGQQRQGRVIDTPLSNPGESVVLKCLASVSSSSLKGNCRGKVATERLYRF